MGRIDWAFLLVFIVGIILFLYGANAYNAIAGYIGLYMWIGAIVGYVLLYIYKEFTKKPAPAQEP